MIGHMGLFSGGAASSESLTPGKFSAAGELGSIGTFLVCIDLVHLRSATYLTTVKRISTIDHGAGIPSPEELFRNRHVVRPVWDERSIWYAYDWTAIGAATRYKWANGPGGDFLVTWPTKNTATDRWYADPFTKPQDWSTYDSTSLPPMTRSTVAEDKYLPADWITAAGLGETFGYKIQPGPLFLIAELGEGQSLEFETKAFRDDPLKIDPTTPTLIDTIPTDLNPSASEAEIALPDGTTINAWMLKIG
jgi:hypothetical protein